MTIKMPRGMRPENVASKEASRYSIDNPWFHKESGTIRATDGRMAISIPVEHGDDDESGQIPGKALKVFAKESKRLSYVSMAGHNGTISCLGMTLPREELGPVPDFDNITPKKDSDAVTVTLNAAMLARLAKGLGTDVVTLQLGETGTPILVSPAGDCIPCPEAIGIIMPLVTT